MRPDEMQENELQDGITPTEDGELSSDAPEEEIPEDSGTPEEEFGQEEEVGQEEQTAAETPKKKGGFQKRIDELVQEREHWREVAKNLAASKESETAAYETPGTPALPPGIPPKPEEEAFDDYTAYIEALTDWKLSVKEAERQQQEAATKFTTWKQEGAAKYADFERVVLRQPREGGPSISPTMAEVINSSPISHELAYHLGQHVKESQRIAALPPLAQARELGIMEAKLTAKPSTQPKTISNAPKPIRPVATTGSDTIPLEELPTEDFIAKRNREQYGPNWKGR